MANAMQMRLQISSDVYFPSWAKLCQVSCSNSPVLPVDALEEVRADHPRHQTTRPSTVVDLRSNKYPRDAALIDASSMWIPCKSFGRFKSDEGAGKNRFLDEQMCINHRIEPWLPTSANSFQTLTSVPTIGEAVETGRSFSAEYRRVHAGYVSDYVSDCVMIVISSARSLWTQPSRWKCHDLPGHHAHRPAQDSTAVNLCSFTVSYSVIWCHAVSYSVIRCRTVSYGVIRCHTVSQLVLQRILSSGPLTPTLNHTWQWYQESSHPGQFSEAHSVSIAVSSWHMSTSQKNVLRHGSTRLNGFGVTLSENPWGDTPPAGNAGSGPPGSVPDSSCFGSM